MDCTRFLGYDIFNPFEDAGVAIINSSLLQGSLASFQDMGDASILPTTSATNGFWVNLPSQNIGRMRKGLLN